MAGFEVGDEIICVWLYTDCAEYVNPVLGQSYIVDEISTFNTHNFLRVESKISTTCNFLTRHFIKSNGLSELEKVIYGIK
jgi:hypothetical protein